MVNQWIESSLARVRRHLAPVLAGVALAGLSGCVVAPVGPYDVGAASLYGAPPQPGYTLSPGYGVPYQVAPAPYATWGPSISLGYWGSWGNGWRGDGWRGDGWRGGHRHPDHRPRGNRGHPWR